MSWYVKEASLRLLEKVIDYNGGDFYNNFYFPKHSMENNSSVDDLCNYKILGKSNRILL